MIIVMVFILGMGCGALLTYLGCKEHMAYIYAEWTKCVQEWEQDVKTFDTQIDVMQRHIEHLQKIRTLKISNR